MIFVTAGTNEQPFERLVSYAARLDGDEALVVQYGSARVAHGRGRWVDFLAWEEMAALMREARAVVAHAGTGSILLAQRCGKRPIVVPRRGDLGEAVDDHQDPLARRLAGEGMVLLADDEESLREALALPPERLALDAAPGAAGGLTDAVAEALARVAGPPSAAGRPAASAAGAAR
ncbi:MAG: glycosyltransferase [Solirubrobacteraceae bacterium]